MSASIHSDITFKRTSSDTYKRKRSYL
ncbi:unnamed protein product [Larinioides sclopetarius]|uniref:Uncharacterized protein n=1 Tax=Larinioides sclopetarius TaxID=280406 RepID=A0AAV1YUB7_9ARAC